MNRKAGWILVTLFSLGLSVFLIPTSHAGRADSRGVPKNANSSDRSVSLPGMRSLLNPSLRQSEGSQSVQPVSSQAVNFAVSEPLISLQNAELAAGTISEAREMNEDNVTVVKQIRDILKAPAREEGLPSIPIQSESPSTPSLTFEGISDADVGALTGFFVAPSDENIDVGPNDVVETVNNALRVWDKNGVPKTAAKLQSALFKNLGGQCAGPDRGDPVVLYDRMADRWFITQFAFANGNAAPFHQCIAISKNNDPTGAYYVYDFITPGTNFPDYGKFGVWPDGYYFTVNQFDRSKPPGSQFNGTGAYAVDRKKMLVGDPTAAFIYFNLGLASHPEGIFSMLPSDQDGLEAPPAGSPNVFSYLISNEFEGPPNDKDGLRLFDFHADFTNPANSTFTERPESPVLVTAFDPSAPEFITGSRSECEQPPPATVANDSLNAITYHLMYRLQYRNRGGIETLVSGTTVNVGGAVPTNPQTYQAGIRYFELQRSSPSGPFILYDNATFSPDAGQPVTGLNRWLPSAAIDNQGNLAVSYATSSTSSFASIRYAGRDFNALGGLTGEQHLFDGTAVQIGSSNRWGDYQSMQVDPADDCTFWTTGQYYATNSSFNYRTRIGRFKFPNCTAPAQGTLSGTITACDSGAPIGGAIVTLSNGFSATTAANGTYSIQVAPGTYTATVSQTARDCTTSTASTLTVVNGSTTTFNACLSGIAKPIIDNTNLTAVTVSGGNGNAIIDANECNTLTIRLDNPGCAPARNVTTTLSTSTPGVTITQSHSPYPDLPVDGNATNLVPFSISTAPGFVCGTTIQFTLTVNFTGGSRTSTFSLNTCTYPTVSGSLAAGDLQQTARLGRDGVVSSCAGTKTCPGPLGAGPRLYDLYSFQNTSATTACATITVTAACSPTTNPIMVAAYLNSFDPSNLCTSYLGDPGGSPGPTNSFAVNVPAGANLLVNVHEINAGLLGCSGYTVNVAGLISNNPGSGECQACSITPPANITVPNDPNQCGAVVTYPAPTSSGTCGVLSASPASGSFFPVGTTTVNVTSTSGATSSFTVTVVDTQPPTITCPANINAQTAPDATSAVVNYSAIGGDNCPGFVLSYNPPSGSSFPLGTTTVTATNTDATGNTATCSFTVTVQQPQTIQLAASAINVPESAPAANFVVTRTGGSVGLATVDFATSDGTATQKGDYTIKLGTLRFAPGETSKIVSVPIINDVYVEGDETFNLTLSNPIGQGVSLGSQTTTSATIMDNDFSAPTSNPIDDAQFFVRQHYLDFLNRQPDTAGLNFWTNIILACGANSNCIADKREDVSTAFFESIEFQETGGYGIRLQRAAFGRKSAEPATRLTFIELIAAQSQIGVGVVIGQPGALATLEENKQLYALRVVVSPAFANAYAAATTADTFVDALFASAGVTPTSAERTAAINAYNAQGTVALARTAALRSVTDAASLKNAEFRAMFVLMEYFGYLRRNPTDAPDTDDSGYQFWFAKLNAFNGDSKASQMVRAFINSTEYRTRFGP